MTELSSNATGTITASENVSFMLSASNANKDTIYTKWYYRANYGTSGYDSTPWTLIKGYSKSNNCEYIFPTVGSYVIGLRAVTDPKNEPSDIQLLGNVSYVE